MDRPSVVVCNASTHRESDSRTPNPLFCVSPMAVNKKQAFRRKSDENIARTMQYDALMSHKAAATSLSRRCVQTP